jgi:hypothetical protein
MENEDALYARIAELEKENEVLKEEKQELKEAYHTYQKLTKSFLSLTWKRTDIQS